MRKSRYTGQQIALALKQAEAGAPVLGVAGVALASGASSGLGCSIALELASRS